MDELITCNRTLTEEENLLLERQNSRLVSEHKARQLELNSQKHWDLFYKRNETRFFKDRHWTTREFEALINFNDDKPKVMLEIGCGVGNLIFPLIQEGLNYYFYACDFSPRAVELVKKHELYNEDVMKVFQTDITTEDIFQNIKEGSVDIVTLVFVLSAIHPENFRETLKNIYRLLKPGGTLLFRDYGLHDMAQIRFKPGHKISENFYMRQDGTRSFYFSVDFTEKLFTEVGFVVVENTYVHRRTVNKKQNVNVGRIFVQSKLSKPA